MSTTTHCRIDKRLIEQACGQQKLTNKRVILADTDCKGLRLVINTQSGSWTYAYRKRGIDHGGVRHPQRTLKLGDLLSLTAAEARLEADKVKALVREGFDPAIERRQEKLERQNAHEADRPLFWWLGKYKATELDIDTKHKRDEITHIQLGLKELSIGGQPPSVLSIDHLRKLIKMHRSRPATARHRFGAISRFLDYLQDQEVIARNPAKDLSRKHRPKPPKPRTNFFDIDDLSLLWFPEKPLKAVYLNYLRFMITTPLRAREASELRFEQVNISKQELYISEEDTKNSEHFLMPLSDLAISLVPHKNMGQHQRIFQLSSRPDAPMQSWSNFTRAVRNTTNVGNFNLHDLRRTFSTLCAENSEFGEGLIDSLLNHKQSATRTGVMRHYQQAKNLKRRREVIDWWGQFLKREVVNASR